jgi:hypothetical protein
MALLATVEGQPVKVEATTNENHILVDSQGYSLAHDGCDTAGAEELDAIFFSPVSGFTASHAAGEKFALVAGRAIEIPDKWRTVYFRTAAGAPTFSVLPKRGK